MIREADTNGDGEIGKLNIMFTCATCISERMAKLSQSLMANNLSVPRNSHADYEEFVRMLS